MKVLITTPTIDSITLVKHLEKRPINLNNINTRDELLELCGNPEYQAGFEWPNAALLFLKENIPSIDILNYPTTEEYIKALEYGKYDVVGFSFYTISANTVVEMAKTAREYGAKEIWAGNFGATTPGFEKYFDRVFIGHGEEQIKTIIEGKKLLYRRHPLMIGKWGWLSMRKTIGFLYTLTGCRYKCKFCPTANFAPSILCSPFEEICRVIDEYYKLAIDYVMIMDETFMQDRDFSYSIMKKLREKEMAWHCVSRINLIRGCVKELREYGMRSIYVGVESLDDRALKDYRKGQRKKDILEVFDELNDNGISVTITYMLGHQHDTEKSFLEAVDIIKNFLKPFCVVFLVLTPHANAKLVTLEKKITDREPTHYDSMHLVWKHPHLDPGQVRDLLWQGHESIVHCGNYPKRKIMKRWQVIKPARNKGELRNSK